MNAPFFFKWIITRKRNQRFEYNNNNNNVLTIDVTVVDIVIIVVFLKCGYIPKFQAWEKLGNILLVLVYVFLSVSSHNKYFYHRYSNIIKLMPGRSMTIKYNLYNINCGISSLKTRYDLVPKIISVLTG